MTEYRNIADRVWLLALLLCGGLAGQGAFSPSDTARGSDAAEHARPTFPGVALPSSVRYEFQPLVFREAAPCDVHSAGTPSVFTGYTCAVANPPVAARRPLPSLFEHVSYRTRGPPLQIG